MRSCLSETVNDPNANGFDHRVTGTWTSDRDPATGLWPSDHGGVVLRLRGL